MFKDELQEQLPFETYNMSSPKDYMKIERESNSGALKISIFLPPYDVS